MKPTCFANTNKDEKISLNHVGSIQPLNRLTFTELLASAPSQSANSKKPKATAGGVESSEFMNTK